LLGLQISTRRWGFSTGVLRRRSTAFPTFNRIVLMPTPSASEAMATAEKPSWHASSRTPVIQVLDQIFHKDPGRRDPADLRPGVWFSFKDLRARPAADSTRRAASCRFCCLSFVISKKPGAWLGVADRTSS
jgi:hypothetical protein